MNTRFQNTLVAVLMATLLSSAALADAGWTKLGDKYVDLAGDHDVIPVTLLKGSFREIRIAVKGNDIFISNVTVIYSTGGSDRLPVLGVLKDGNTSRALDLRGNDRHIRSIELTYRRVPNFHGLAEVTVYAR